MERLLPFPCPLGGVPVARAPGSALQVPYRSPTELLLNQQLDLLASRSAGWVRATVLGESRDRGTAK